MRYEMLCVSRNLAVSAHSLSAADVACWELSQHFDVSLDAARLEMLQAAQPMVTGQDESAAYVRMALQTIDDALLRH